MRLGKQGFVVSSWFVREQLYFKIDDMYISQTNCSPENQTIHFTLNLCSSLKSLKFLSTSQTTSSSKEMSFIIISGESRSFASGRKMEEISALVMKHSPLCLMTWNVEPALWRNSVVLNANTSDKPFHTNHRCYSDDGTMHHWLSFILLLHITQVVWFNSVSLLQWKVSNHEVFLLCITLLGFCCVHRNWPHQASVWNCEMHTKQTHIHSHELINDFFSAKHDCVTVSQPT